MTVLAADWTSNHGLFRIVNDFSRHTAWAHGVMAIYAVYAPVFFAGLLVVGWWIARRQGSPTRMAAALWTPFGALLALGLGQPINHLVAEPRPYYQMQHVLVLVPRTTDFAFPSDHATMAAAVTVGMLYVSRRFGIITGLFGLLLGFARVYVGAHFPGDILGGYVLGAVVVLATVLLLRRPIAALVVALERTRLRPLLTAAPPAASTTPDRSRLSVG